MMVDGQSFVKATFDDEGRRVIVVTTFALYPDLSTAAAAMSLFASRFPDKNDVVIDFYTWQSEPLRETEKAQQEIRGVLEKTGFPERVLRIVVAVNAPGKGLGMTSTQHFTYRPAQSSHDKSGGYQEDRLYRGLHPMMGERLHI